MKGQKQASLGDSAFCLFHYRNLKDEFKSQEFSCEAELLMCSTSEVGPTIGLMELLARLTGQSTVQECGVNHTAGGQRSTPGGQLSQGRLLAQG